MIKVPVIIAMLLLKIFPLLILQGAHAFVTTSPLISTACGPSRPLPSLRASADGDSDDDKAPLPFRRALLASTAAAATELVFTQFWVRPGFRRVRPTQFIAALGDPNAREGTGAEQWGVWAVDPGPRGVPLDRYSSELLSRGGSDGTAIAPAGWGFDSSDFWLEEHGLIMEAPVYDIPTGRYLVTGGRGSTHILTVEPKGPNGTRRWHLDQGVLNDVTHGPCRSGRYIARAGEDGSPAKAQMSDFPVRPGGTMPEVDGCAKQDYAVLFVTGIETA